MVTEKKSDNTGITYWAGSINQELDIETARFQILNNGSIVLKNFISLETVDRLVRTWTSVSNYAFDDFIKNVDIKSGSNAYMYSRPTKNDFVYCQHIWNVPIDEELHEIAYLVQQIRNRLEGEAIYKGLHECHGTALQYRVCRTVSSGQTIFPHADFFEEIRRDPTGNHSFNPCRMQGTLLLSTFGKDYHKGGFKLWNDDRSDYQILGKEIEAKAGDLIFWRYSLLHEVSDIEIINSNIGFLRVIFPIFELAEN